MLLLDHAVRAPSLVTGRRVTARGPAACAFAQFTRRGRGSATTRPPTAGSAIVVRGRSDSVAALAGPLGTAALIVAGRRAGSARRARSGRRPPRCCDPLGR